MYLTDLTFIDDGNPNHLTIDDVLFHPRRFDVVGLVLN